MLTQLRAATRTWAVKAVLLLLVAAFAIWGIGSDMVGQLGGKDRSVARIGDAELPPEEFSRDVSRAVQAFARRQGAEPTPEQRRQIADEVLSVAVTQRALRTYQTQLGLGTADDQVVREVRAVPVFRDPKTQQFDRARFDEAVRARGVSEGQFMDLVRQDQLNRQLLGALRAGAAVPSALTREVFAYEHETRSADVVFLSFADRPAPPAPTLAEQQRWYDNHPAAYGTPEYRRLKLVALSPDAVARGIDVADADLATAYAEHLGDFQKPETRTAEIATVDTEILAQNLATAWRAGAPFDAIQKLAEGHGSAVSLEDSPRAEFPETGLADAVFAAGEGTVTDPAKTPNGYRVFRVARVQAATNTSLEAAKPALKARVARDRATSLVYERANKLDELLSGGASLDELPGDLGLIAATGTLDRAGKTAEGTDAPLPGPAPLRAALIEGAFAAQPGDPPRMEEVKLETGAQAYYALTVEEVTPTRVRPFDEVKDTVLADLTADRRRRDTDAAATALRVAVQGGRSLADAAAEGHATVSHLPASGRATPGAGVPKELLGPLFAATPAEPAQLETTAGFVVAVPTDVTRGNPDADPIGAAQLRTGLAQAIGADTEALTEAALRNRNPPTVNRALFDQIVKR